VAAAPFRMPGAPFANWAVVAFLVIVSALLWLDDDTRVALYVAPCWFGLLAVGYLWLKRRPPAAARAAS
jgi:AAT family amino acid transporter